MLDPSILSCKGVFTRILVLYYLGPVLAFSYLNVKPLEILGCYISEGCNSSFISLIPKIENPLNLNDFRPISLIDSYYKIVSKVLTARLQKVIGSVIGEEQHAFIHGRYILDGVLIANELVDFVRKK